MTETADEAGPAPALAFALSQRIEEPVHMLVTPLEDLPLVSSVERSVIHQYAPGDTEGTVRRFLDHWRPDLGVIIGHPARPNLLAAAKARAIPLFHAVARRDARTQARKWPTYLGGFDTCFAASASDANFLRSHLRNHKTTVEISGPLSDTVYALPCNEAECSDLAKLLGGRPVWLAAEVSGEELDIVEAAHRKAFRSAHRLLLIIVPRDGENVGDIAGRLEGKGWRVARRSNMEEPDPETQIYLADTEDELGLWYRLAPASFIGGSLREGVEPTDPFHAAALGSAVLHGGNFGRNPARFKALEQHGASMRVTNAEDLGEAVITLLAPDKAASLAQAGWAATTESAHVVERLAEVLEERFIDRAGGT
jgi:3-deoxy-D-manno-octulosonic-acid transferase